MNIVRVVRAAFVLSTITAAAIAAPASAELITNGGFETGNFSGWTTSGNVGVFGISSFGLTDPTFGRFLVAFNGADSPPNGVLSQTIATMAGSAYNVGYSYGVTSGGNQSIVASILDANTLAVLGTQTASTTSSAPGRFGFSFTAASGSTIVRFRDLATNPTASQDGRFDNVSVTAAVPEPATWAMMVLGFGGMSFAMRRKARVSTRIRFA